MKNFNNSLIKLLLIVVITPIADTKVFSQDWHQTLGNTSMPGQYLGPNDGNPMYIQVNSGSGILDQLSMYPSGLNGLSYGPSFTPNSQFNILTYSTGINPFSITDHSSGADVFDIYPSGNTFLGGTLGIGVLPLFADATLNIINNTAFTNQFSITTSSGNDVTQIDDNGDAYFAGNVGIGTPVPAKLYFVGK
jgi:hypothetical protein